MEIDTIVRAGVFLGWLVAASALLLRRRGRREAQTHQPSRGAIVGIALQLAGMAIAWGRGGKGDAPLLAAAGEAAWVLAALAVGLAWASALWIVAAVRSLGK